MAAVALINAPLIQERNRLMYGQKIKRHKSVAKLHLSQRNYDQCLTIICPTVSDGVGQFLILQQNGRIEI